MTGVEKVRDLATVVCGARFGRQYLPDVHTPQEWQDVIGKYCMAYGAYLRGLIEMWGQPNSRVIEAIAAWREVVNADQA